MIGSIFFNGGVMGKITKKSISLVLVLSLLVSLVWVPKPVYAANVIQSIGDFLTGIDDWVYEHSWLGAMDKKRAKYYTEALPVQPQANYIDSNNEYNEYIYAGGNTYYYTPITTNNNQTYRYYDIDNNIYRTTNNFEYSPTYNTYHMTYEDNDTTYNYYMQDNYTYVSYIIQCPENPNENKYFEVYYELPDGRNSYNLRSEDLAGIVFTYDVELYDRAAVDDSLGLWHLDGNLLNEVTATSEGASYSSSNYYDAYYQGGAKIAVNQSLSLSFNGNLPTDYTLEWVQYNPSKSDSYTNNQSSSSSQSFSGYTTNNGTRYNDSCTIYSYSRSINGTYYFYDGSRGQYNKFAIVHNSEGNRYYINGNEVSSLSFGPSLSNGKVLFSSTSSTYSNTSSQYQTNSITSGGLSGSEYRYTTFTPHYVGLFNSSSGWNLINNFYAYGFPRHSNWSLLDFEKYFTQNNNVSNGYPSMGPYSWSRGYDPKVGYDYVLNFSFNKRINDEILIDEVRLSEGELYSENYIPRNEPFDLSYAYVVPSNVSEGVVYAQSSVPVSRFQIGGVRNTNPSEGELFVNTTGTVADSAQQYYEGLWHSIAAAVYFEGELKNIEGFDFVNMMFVAGTSASGGSFVIEIPEEVTSLLEKIDKKLASILNPLKEADGEDVIPFKAVDTEDDTETFHLSDLFILLVYFILFIDILGDFVSMFAKLTAWAYHLWAIQGLPGPLAGNEYFMGVHTILHGGTAFGLPQPIKIFGVVTLHDFMVILFEIAFIGVMIGFYRKKLTTFRFPSLRS